MALDVTVCRATSPSTAFLPPPPHVLPPITIPPSLSLSLYCLKTSAHHSLQFTLLSPTLVPAPTRRIQALEERPPAPLNSVVNARVECKAGGAPRPPILIYEDGGGTLFRRPAPAIIPRNHFDNPRPCYSWGYCLHMNKVFNNLIQLGARGGGEKREEFARRLNTCNARQTMAGRWTGRRCEIA